MNDENTRELVRQSVLKTPEAFSDTLMEKVKTRESLRKMMRWHFPIVILLVSVSILIAITLPDEMNLLYVKLRLSPGLLMVSGVLICFVVLNKLLILKKEITKLDTGTSE